LRRLQVAHADEMRRLFAYGPPSFVMNRMGFGGAAIVADSVEIFDIHRDGALRIGEENYGQRRLRRNAMFKVEKILLARRPATGLLYLVSGSSIR